MKLGTLLNIFVSTLELQPSFLRINAKDECFEMKAGLLALPDFLSP